MSMETPQVSFDFFWIIYSLRALSLYAPREVIEFTAVHFIFFYKSIFFNFFQIIIGRQGYTLAFRQVDGAI